MRVKIHGKVKNFRTVWYENGTVNLIDQRKLPYKFEIYRTRDFRDTASAIGNMIVRGAPAIGATAAFGMAQAAFRFKGNDMEKFKEYMKNAADLFRKTRPTAHDLFYAINLMDEIIEESNSVGEAKYLLKKKSQEYADKSAEMCKRIGKIGEKLISNNDRILTHCNAGALGCVDYGTALSVIRFARYNNKDIFVFVDETRPRCQGSKLTAWELEQEGIRYRIIADNAAGYYMQNSEIDLVIVGADRIAINGDIANKIGTYEKAVLAKENSIPFYVAAPESTIDISCKSGGDIEIEERGEDEVLYISGMNESGKFTKVRISPFESKARNPAFDVTPAKYITGIITERGIYKPEEIKGEYSL